MSYKSLHTIINVTKSENISFFDAVINEQLSEHPESYDDCFNEMRLMYMAMKDADKNYDGKLKSTSNVAGGDGEKLEIYNKKEDRLLDGVIATVMEKAVKIGESNACMKRIVAAPTAGSCGVIPAVFISYEETHNISLDKMTEALFVSAGIGAVITELASISGAEGGCQAEIGSASAMAAGGIAYLEGGDAECIAHASALALKSLLGLTCDPVAGLVEVPCIKRNVIGAVNALTSAQMALAGIRSAILPDEVIETMGQIGELLPKCLKETGEAGLAVTESGLNIAKKLS